MYNIIHKITQYILLILTNRLKKAEKQENATFCKKILTEQKRRDIV